MYAIIKKVWAKFFTKKQAKATIIENNQDITLIISANVETEQINCKISTDIDDILQNSSSISKCEKIAYFLSVVCENNKYMTDLISHNMNQQKTISDNHLLFYDNILFFWKQYLSFKKTASIYENEPMIKPSKAFKSYVTEEKI